MISEEVKDPCVWEGDPILVEYKGEKTQYSFHLAATSNWGNPWDHTLEREDFKVSSPEEATENFRKWLWGEDFTNVLQKKRKWLLLNLKYLKGKKLAYDYKPYAQVLIDAIDKDIKIPDIELIPKEEKIEKTSIKKKVKSIF